MKKLNVGIMAVCAVMAYATSSFAAFTLPALPVTDIETAGAAVAGLVAAYVVIRMAIRMIKGA